MDYLTSKKFSFISSALAPDTFGVVHFKGNEAISSPYQFEIMLVSTRLDINLEGVIQSPARLVIHREDGDDVVYHGILVHFEQLHSVGEYGFYRANLAPKLWWLSLTHHNQVILNKSLPDIVADVLRDGGLTSLDFEFRLKGTYAPLDYICQYGESNLNFISRRLERECARNLELIWLMGRLKPDFKIYTQAVMDNAHVGIVKEVLRDASVSAERRDDVLGMIRDVMASDHKTYVYNLPLPTRDPVYVSYPLETSDGDALLAAHRKYKEILEQPRTALPEDTRREIAAKIPGVLDKSWGV